MDSHGLLSAIACAGHLAFALLAWSRRRQSPVAPWLALLFLDTFAWNFADLAFGVTHVEYWHGVDRVFSSLMPALALHVVVVFVGRARALRLALFGNYVVFGAVALSFRSELWWRLLLCGGSLAMLLALIWLLRYRRSLTDDSERARTDLIGWAIALGTVFSSTDLWANELQGIDAPRLGNLATLFAMGLFAAATLRLGLLGGDVPRVLIAYAALAGVLGVVACVAAVNLLDSSWAVPLLSATALTAVLVASVREFGRQAALARERTHRLTLLGRLSEQLAHDLKNPLAALKGALEFLQTERRAGRSLDPHAEFLGLMLEQVGRVDRTVSEYQRMAKVEPELRAGSLNRVVEQVLSLQRFAAPERIAIRAELGAELPPCSLDADLVAAALDNLLRNAVEAMADTGTITVRTALHHARSHLALTVEDQGGGMPARELERATDELYTTKAGGTGLGLSFVQRVARAHAGRLEIASEPGRGTRATLFIPVAELEYSEAQ
ncbi:MAG: ATP-binding protein [Polyangiaceae bacterium]